MGLCKLCDICSYSFSKLLNRSCCASYKRYERNDTTPLVLVEYRNSAQHNIGIQQYVHSHGLRILLNGAMLADYPVGDYCCSMLAERAERNVSPHL